MKDKPLPPSATNCPNCAYYMAAHEQYCANCGQKRIKKISFFMLANDVFQNIFSLDSKLFRTLGNLLFSPGKLTLDFISGKHQRYYTPGKLFLWIMAIHLLLLGSFFDLNYQDDSLKAIAYKNLAYKDFYQALDSSLVDSLAQQKVHDLFDQKYDSAQTINISILSMEQQLPLEKLMLAPVDSLVEEFDYNDIFTKILVKQGIKTIRSPNSLNNYLMSNLSWGILFLLPFFALLLKGLYRKHYYIDHLVFTLHIHAFVLLIMSVLYTLNWLNWISFVYVVLLSFLCAILYFVLATKRVYPQRVLVLLLRLFLFGIGYLLLVALAIVVFFLIGFISM